jgi:secreted Zn-dependent insulinase-like peptidase
VQSNVICPNSILKLNDKFITTFFEEKVKNISDEEFNLNISTLISLHQTKDKKLSEESIKIWGEIDNGQYEWKRDEKQIEILKKITKKDVIEFYEKYLLFEHKRLIIQIFSKKFFDQINNDENDFITDIDDFKSKSSFFPTFSKF